MFRNKFLYAISLTAVVTVFSGCGVKVETYNASADNVNMLRHFNKKIDLQDFTTSVNSSSIMCRMANRVVTPNGETFVSYIEKALEEELKMAGLYDESSAIKLTGHLNAISANSSFGANWSFNFTVKSNNGKSITVNTVSEYTTSFAAYYACEHNMPKAFKPAVQTLIKDILNHPDFESLLVEEK